MNKQSFNLQCARKQKFPSPWTFKRETTTVGKQQVKTLTAKERWASSVFNVQIVLHHRPRLDSNSNKTYPMKWWRGGTMASLLTVCESESSFFFLKQHFATITLWCRKRQATSVSFRVQFVWSVCFLHNGPVFRWKWRQSNTGDGANADWCKREIVHRQPLGGSTIKAHQTAAGNLHILRSKEMIMSEGGP